MGSTRKEKILHGLISTRNVKLLLEDVANFDPVDFNDPSVKRFWLRWAKSFPEYNFDDPTDTTDFYELLVLSLAPALRSAWGAQTTREREWHAINARHLYHTALLKRSALGVSLEKMQAEGKDASNVEYRIAMANYQRRRTALPLLTVLDVALQYFQQLHASANVCTNPRCAAPYFLGSKVGQKFCSDPCALPAKQAAKRRWWNEQGSELRRQKAEAAKGGR